MLYNKVKKVCFLGVVSMIVLCFCSCTKSKINIHMFSDIEECQQIIELKTDISNITIYDSTKEDKYIKKLEFQNWFGCEYISADISFELFAYEFFNNDDAMTYYKQITGKGNDPNPTFSTSTGMGFYKRIVVFENKAYIVSCKKNDKDKVVEFINDLFSMDVTGSFKFNE